MIVNCICLVCSKGFYRKPSKIKIGGGKYCSKKCHGIAKSGENNYMWKGKGASYIAKHMWMYLHFGKPSKCENCGSIKAKRYDWANISGKYKRDRKDWLRLCKSCHVAYDDITNKGWRTRRMRQLS